MKQKDKKVDFSICLMSALGASLLGNMLASKSLIRAGDGTVRTGQDFSCRVII